MTRDRTFARRSLQAIVEVERASVPRSTRCGSPPCTTAQRFRPGPPPETSSISWTTSTARARDPAWTRCATHVVVAPRIHHDPRWPRDVPAAVELGLRSQLAVKLYLDDQGTLGGLNLYSTTSDVAPRQRGPLSFSPPTPPSPSAMPANASTSTRPCTHARSSARPSAFSWNATP